jgi:hypothetical protein
MRVSWVEASSIPRERERRRNNVDMPSRKMLARTANCQR